MGKVDELKKCERKVEEIEKEKQEWWMKGCVERGWKKE